MSRDDRQADASTPQAPEDDLQHTIPLVMPSRIGWAEAHSRWDRPHLRRDPLRVYATRAVFLDLLAVLPAPPAGLGVAEWSVTFVFAFALGAPAVATSAVALLSHGLWLLLVVGLGAASAGALAEMWPRRAKSDAS